MKNQVKLEHISVKEVVQILLDKGMFQDYVVDYIKEIDGKFKCRLKQPNVYNPGKWYFYSSSNQTPFDTKFDAIYSSLLLLRSMGSLSHVDFPEYKSEENSSTEMPVKKPGRKKKIVQIKENDTMPPVEVNEIEQIPIPESEPQI